MAESQKQADGSQKRSPTMNDAHEPVPVLTTHDANEAEVLKAMLEAEGIPAQVEGEHQGGFTGVLQSRLLVRAQDAERAREFLAQHGD
jgi:hypothetical protein